jgi:hypothetical protein
MPFKCLVRGCENYSDAGEMKGPLCSPCDRMLRNGTCGGHGLNWVAKMERKFTRVLVIVNTED